MFRDALTRDPLRSKANLKEINTVELGSAVLSWKSKMVLFSLMISVIVTAVVMLLAVGLSHCFGYFGLV